MGRIESWIALPGIGSVSLSWMLWDGFGGGEPRRSLLPPGSGFVSCFKYAQAIDDLSRYPYRAVRRGAPASE